MCFRKELFLLIIPFYLFAEMSGIADNGKKVILKDDGTWVYSDTVINETNNKIEIDDFRNCTWGMSISEVKNIEKESLITDQSNNKVLTYSSTIGGLDAIIGYFFVNNKLYLGKYRFLEDHTNLNDHILDYETIKKLLITKYGNPKKSEPLWRNDLYKKDYQDWGMALSVGHLMLFSHWDTPTTTIYLGLGGDNFKIKFDVEYHSKALEKEADDDKNAKRAADF